MNTQPCYFLLLLVLISSLACRRECVAQDDCLLSINRNNFPKHFVFGTSSSAYQYEGAAHEGGKGLSIWDTFVRKHPDKIKDRSTGDVADDQYHLYKEDVALMKNIGMDAYRFSISWSRLLPHGKKCPVNPEGVAYYNNLIDELLRNGLKPFATLFHWDLPQALEKEYKGFLSDKIVDDFQNYAELCFALFGDRVKHWITFNEPLTFASGGYATGALAPGRCSPWMSSDCAHGDSGTEPYKVAKNLLVAHAKAVQVYRQKYKNSQNGQIGITLNSLWVIPLTNSTEDRLAASRSLTFMYDWWLEPLKSGTWPAEMVEHVRDRIPPFSQTESLMIKGSYDFLGINYYTTYYVYDVPCKKYPPFSYTTDSCTNTTAYRNGTAIGPKAGSDWLYVYPEGIFELLNYTNHKLNNNPIIYITENGIDEVNHGEIFLNDTMRIDYHCSHLSYVHKAIENGVNVSGYFVWTFLDDFEWNEGYTVRFGIVFVDYNDNLRRIPKQSATWFQRFLNPNAGLGSFSI